LRADVLTSGVIAAGDRVKEIAPSVMLGAAGRRLT
jgi:hypothetical protein